MKRTLDELAASIKEAKRIDPNCGYRKIAKRLGEHPSRVRRIYLSLFKGSDNANNASVSPSFTDRKTSTGRKVTSVSSRITTVEGMIEHLQLDLTKWRIKQSIANKWEVGAKIPDEDGKEKIVVEPLWQIKLWIVPVVADRDVIAIDDMIEDLKTYAPVYQKAFYPKVADGVMLEISIPDLHLGQLSWPAETMRPPWDTDIAMSLFDTAVQAIVERAMNSFGIEQILLPIGNDFFNIDSLLQATTSGTHQDEDSRWKKSFKEGRRLIQRTVERLATVAPVKVLIVPGNHDEQRSFYLGDVLEAVFDNHPDVTIDNSPTRRKYHRHGQVLLGFAHGKDETEKDLPLILAQEAKKDWALATWSEFHIGHFHHTHTRVYAPVNEQNGVTVRLFPSLAAPDAWHISKGYTHATRSAIGLCWSKDSGLAGTFPFYAPERVAA